MNLPEYLRERLVSEYQIALKEMNATSNPLRKMYFFSVFYGEAQRVLNMHWDNSLSLVHMVTSVAFRSIDPVVKAIAQRAEPVVTLDEAYWETLTETCQRLIEFIDDGVEDSGRLLDVLSRLAELTYMVTGNGYYLHLKGKIKVGTESSALPQPS